MIQEKIIAMMAQQFRAPEASITRDSRLLEDLNADSASVMMLVMDMEQEFDITVDDEMLGGVRTVGDVIDCIEKAKKA